MEVTHYLLFTLNERNYGIEAHIVREIVWLPEITGIEEAPDYIIGVINLRERVVPVMSLGRRIGAEAENFKITDRVLVVESDNSITGIVINDIYDVCPIPAKDIENAPDYGRQKGLDNAFITNMARSDEGIIMLLDHTRVFDADFNISFGDIKAGASDVEKSFTDHFPDATSDERDILSTRARTLKLPVSSREAATLNAMAVVNIADEYYGIELKDIREFSKVRSYTPVPCCPSHIVGNINLRGDILTLIDIRQTLNLSTTDSYTGADIVVVAVDDFITGITVDNIHDVAFIDPREINLVPVAVQSDGIEFLKGTVRYENKILAILDIKRILRDGNLVVDENV